MHQEIPLHSLRAPFVQSRRLDKPGNAAATYGCFRIAASHQPWRNADVDFVDRVGIEKAAEDLGATFDQDVGHLSFAQFVQ